MPDARAAADRRADLRGAHDRQDHGLEGEERAERAAAQERVELVAAPGDAAGRAPATITIDGRPAAAAAAATGGA